MIEKELIDLTILNYPEKIVESKSRRPKYKINKAGQTVMSNPRTAGTPKYFVINMQPIYSGNMHYRKRATIVKIIKDAYFDYFKDIPKFNKSDYPIILDLQFTNCTTGTDFDNFTSLLRKCLLDMLVKQLGIIKDDKRKYICGFREVYFEDDSTEKTELKIKFIKINNKRKIQ